MVWMKYETHEYMDMYPEIGYHLFYDEAQAKAWEEHMQKNYSGGITRLLGPAKQQEILDYIKDNNMSPDELTMNNINNKEYYQTL